MLGDCPGFLGTFDEAEMSISDAADSLNLSVATTRRLAAEGAIRARKVGKAWVVTLQFCRACGAAKLDSLTTSRYS